MVLDLVSPETETPQNISVHTKLNVFEFQNVLQAMGVLIPNELVISIFGASKSREVDDSGASLLSISEVNDDLDHSVGYEEDLTVVAIIKKLLVDVDFFFTFLLFFAGILLMLNSFFSEIIPSDTRRNIGLVASLCYAWAGGRGVFKFPLNEFKARVSSEKLIKQFKELMLNNAVAYAKSKNARSSESEFLQLLSYIEEKIFEFKTDGYLTKGDMELLLLKELGESFTSRVLTDTLAVVDKDGQGTIRPSELHHFLASKDRSGTSFGHAYAAAMTALTSFSFIVSLFFFMGSVIGILLNILGRRDKDLSVIFGDVNIYIVTGWVSLIGCLSFTHMAYEWISAAFDRKEHAKEVLGFVVRYASHYQRDKEIWKNFNKNEGLDKGSLAKLLEEADIVLPTGELNAMFNEIDDNGNGFLSKSEIEEYLDNEQNRTLAIARLCLYSMNFWANVIWVIGAFLYILPLYIDGDNFATWCYRFGGTFFMIGGMSLVYMAYDAKHAHLLNLTKLNIVIDLLMEGKKDIMNLIPMMHRFKSPMFYDLDEENQASSSRITASIHSSIGNMPVEGLLSRLMSCDTGREADEFLSNAENQEFISELESSSTSTLLAPGIPLLMYSHTSDGPEGHQSGILYMCPSGFNPKGFVEIDGSLSSNGTKLHITLPWDRHYSSSMDVFLRASSGPSTIIGGLKKMFDEVSILSPELEVNLPLKENPSRKIGSPTLIYSQDGTGPAFIHFELVETGTAEASTANP